MDGDSARAAPGSAIWVISSSVDPEDTPSSERGARGGIGPIGQPLWVRLAKRRAVGGRRANEYERDEDEANREREQLFDAERAQDGGIAPDQPDQHAAERPRGDADAE